MRNASGSPGWTCVATLWSGSAVTSPRLGVNRLAPIRVDALDGTRLEDEGDVVPIDRSAYLPGSQQRFERISGISDLCEFATRRSRQLAIPELYVEVPHYPAVRRGILGVVVLVVVLEPIPQRCDSISHEAHRTYECLG